jgi:hypothetical protein
MPVPTKLRNKKRQSLEGGCFFSFTSQILIPQSPFKEQPLNSPKNPQREKVDGHENLSRANDAR